MRAKFQCNTVMKDMYSNETVTLSPVYGKDGTANAEWAKASPSGSLSLTISNPAAQGFLKPGGQYFLDFTEAPPEG